MNMHIHSVRARMCMCVYACVKTVFASRIGAWLPGSKEIAARGARQTEDSGQRAQQSVESCDARGWCGMVVDGRVGDD